MKRLGLILFPALLGPSQLLFFGPFTVYSSNRDEFVGPFWQLVAPWAWPLALVVGALAALGLLMSERLFTRYVAGLLALGVLLWAQGNLLVADYGLLYGEGLDLAPHAWRAPMDIGIWIGVTTLALWFAPRVSPVAPLASQVLVALQVTVVIASLVSAEEGPSADVWRRPPEDIYGLSRTRNVIHIVLDGFQSDYFGEIGAADPATFERDFSGFVQFANHLGAFPTTKASMPAMLTGVPYRNEMPFERYFNQSARTSVFYAMGQRGYRIHSVSFLGFEHPDTDLPGGEEAVIYNLPTPYSSYRDYVDFTSAQIVDLSLFRHVPHGTKSGIYNDREWLIQRWYANQQPLVQAAQASRPGSHVAFLEEFARRVTLTTDDPVFTFIHVAIPHPPLVTEADCTYVGPRTTEPDAYRAQASCGLRTVAALLNRLRALDVYDDAGIVITADHGWRVPRPTGPFSGLVSPAGDLGPVALDATPVLVVKAPGASGPVTVSHAPTAITDIPSTLFDLGGLPNVFGRGESALRVDPDARRRRTFAHHSWDGTAWRRPYFDVLHMFDVDGHVSDPAAWRFLRPIFEPTDNLAAQLKNHQAGLHPPERGPEGLFRWTTHQAVVYLTPSMERFVVDARRAPAVSGTQTVTVRIDGVVVGRHELDDDRWRTLEYALEPRGGQETPFCVELLVSPDWRDESNARVGVMLRGDVVTR